MEKFAEYFGTFMGYAIGFTLKIAGPELREFLIGVVADAITKVLDDRAVVGKPTDDWQRMWTTGSDRAAGNSPDPKEESKG